MSTLLQEQPLVGQAYERYQQFNRDERLRALDEAHQRFLHDQATDIEEAHNKGITEGESKGKIEIARNMKQRGYSTSDIAGMTGLSLVDIERL